MSDLISDLDELTEGLTVAPAKKCSVGFVLDQVTADERTKLEAVLDANIVPATRIAEILRRNGYAVHYSSVTRHRRRNLGQAGCTCP